MEHLAREPFFATAPEQQADQSLVQLDKRQFVNLQELELGSPSHCPNPNCAGLCEQCSPSTSSPISSIVYNDTSFAVGLPGPSTSPQLRFSMQPVPPRGPQLHIPYQPQQTFKQRLDNDQFSQAQASGLVNVADHVGQLYTPGFNTGLMIKTSNEGLDLLGITQSVNNFAIQTPATTVPSIAEEGSFIPTSFRVADFVSSSDQTVTVEYDWECSPAIAQKFGHLVNSEAYRVHRDETVGSDSAIKALQKSMSFDLNKHGRTAHTTPQLHSMLRKVQVNDRNSMNRAVPEVTPEDLKNILVEYENITGIAFQLGVVSSSSEGVYRLHLHRMVTFGGHGTIWLFYEPNTDQWFPIIPYESQNAPSYASVLAKPPPRPLQPILQLSSQAPDLSLLHPGYPSSPANGESGVQRRNRRFSSGRQTPRNRRGSNASRAASEPGMSSSSIRVQKPDVTLSSDKPHKCDVCRRGFLYPKDLKRHMSTHSACKPYKCAHCPKAFTRKDNLGRHIKDDHSGVTPATSSVIST